MKWMILTFVTVFILMACSSKKFTMDSLNGVAMEIEKLNGKKVQEPEEKERTPVITLNTVNKSFFMSGGCNRISGEFESKEPGQIRFFNVVRTAMACEQLAFEDELLAAINSVDGIAKKGKKYLLKSGSNVIAEIEAFD